MSDRRVVVTGLGMIAPVGLSVETSWENVLAGKSGIQPITHLDIEPFSTHFGGPIYGFEVTDYIPKKEARKMDKFIHYGIAAGCQAIKDAGFGDVNIMIGGAATNEKIRDRVKADFYGPDATEAVDIAKQLFVNA